MERKIKEGNFNLIPCFPFDFYAVNSFLKNNTGSNSSVDCQQHFSMHVEASELAGSVQVHFDHYLDTVGGHRLTTDADIRDASDINRD